MLREDMVLVALAAIAVFTLLLVAGTSALAVYTLKLWRTTLKIATDAEKASADAFKNATDAVNLARDEFNTTHRPKIFVRGFHTLEKAGNASVVFVYVNGGIGKARITEICTDLIIADTIRTNPVFDQRKIDGIVLESGDKEVFELMPRNVVAEHFNFGRDFNTGEANRLSRRPAYIVGSIAYEDSAGRKRETGFCRRNMPGTDRWEIVENSEYEYQD